MTLPRTVACLLVLALALVPALGLAGDDLSASPFAKGQHAQLQHRPERSWRTVVTTFETSSFAPAAAPVRPLHMVDATLALPLVVTIPFVPPRG
jgi:hypothetical protein